MTVPTVEDFPQMWERPSFDTLLNVLDSLEVRPPAWNHKQRQDEILAEQESLVSQKKGEVTRYLSSIIKSRLSWILEDNEREQLWELASKRMSERCGRTAMGEVVRSWLFDGGEDIYNYEPFELDIREPALTGDSLGFKTWGSSYLLAQELPRLQATSLFNLFDQSLGQAKLRVLELGSGTGLLGIAAAAMWKASVSLTDLPNIVTNLKVNAAKNVQKVEAMGGSLTVGSLTWGSTEEDEFDYSLFGEPFQFQIVLAADPLYDDDHPTLLASTISQHLALSDDSRAVVMIPQRDGATRRLLASFKAAMLGLGMPLLCREEEELSGEDDWSGDEEGGCIKCWLGLFSRDNRRREGNGEAWGTIIEGV